MENTSFSYNSFVFLLQNVKLEPQPLLRDSIIHLCVITVLACILLDGVIEWIEALVLVISYFIYFIVMLAYKRILSSIKRSSIFKGFLYRK
jgi:Ca2+/Na+ antiporter